jgi:hypothetical protein
MIGILFLLLVGYFVYWLFSRPKQGGKNETPAVQDEMEFPKFFLWILAAVLVAFNVFLYGANPGIGLGAFQAISMIAVFACLPAKKRNPLTMFLTLLGIGSGLAIGWRANGFVQSVNVVVFWASFLVLLLLLVVDRIHWTGTWLVRYFFKGFLSSFGHTIRLFQRTKKNDNSQLNFTTVLRTSVITVIVLAFFVGLLSQADPIFAKLVAEIWEEALGRAVASVFVAVIFAVLVTLRLKTKQEDEGKVKFLSFQDVLVPGVAVGAVFGIFLFVQAKYLFGSQVDLATFGLTYSQYVRKGFIELLTATFFGGLLSYCIALMARQEESKSRTWQLQGLNSVLIVELGFLLASAWKRNAMYMDVYGLTRVRLVGELFLVWLAGFLGLLLLFSLWKKWTEARLFAGVLLLSTAVFVGLNVRNIDQTIVAASPSHHDFHDYFYLTSLSEDAKVGWPTTLDAARGLLTNFQQKSEFSPVDKAQLANMKLALIALREKRDKLNEKYLPYDKLRQMNSDKYPEKVPSWIESERKWQAWNYAQERGFLEMQTNSARYHEELDNLIADIIDLQKSKDLDLYEQEWRLLHELEYPFVSVNLRYYPQNLESIESSNNPTQVEWSRPRVIEVSPTPIPDTPY